MNFPVMFLLVRRVLDLLRLGPSPDEKDVEIAVLRHQLAVLRLRGVKRTIRALTSGAAAVPRKP
jgi:hypothetical protein